MQIHCRILGIFAVLTIICSSTWAAPVVSREELGRTVKMTVLVDKVMQLEADRTTEEWMIQETVENGFNVFSPRWGNTDFDEVRQVAQWCKQYGIYHMPWMRGTLTAPEGPQADGKRYIHATGFEQALWSPNADELWEWKTDLILKYAEISRTEDHLMGVFLDYENYAPGKAGNCYNLSYDAQIMQQFCAARQIELPELDPVERKVWLDEQNLHEAFEEFQVNVWRERCRQLREAVDRINPDFQFCIYPAPGTKFMLEACTPEWSNERAPIILADPYTYGRPGTYMSHNAALKENRRILERNLQVAQNTGVPLIYIGGIDPVVPGADPEFSGKNAVVISEVTDGYWIFYEGPTYDTTHPEYFKWFSWANRNIAEGNLTAWQEKRETEDPSGFPRIEFDAAALAGLVGEGEMVEFPEARMRRGNMIVVAGQKDVPVSLTFNYHVIGRSTADVEWWVRDVDWQIIEEGVSPGREQVTIAFTPAADGLYPVVITAGGSAYSLIRANAPVGLFARDLGLSFIFAVERLYFHVPAGLEEFTLRVRGQGGETIRLTVFDPDENAVATGQTVPANDRLELVIPVGAHADAVWSLSLTAADEGVLEDHTIWLDEALAPTLSLIKEQVFKLK